MKWYLDNAISIHQIHKLLLFESNFSILVFLLIFNVNFVNESSSSVQIKL